MQTAEAGQILQNSCVCAIAPGTSDLKIPELVRVEVRGGESCLRKEPLQGLPVAGGTCIDGAVPVHGAPLVPGLLSPQVPQDALDGCGQVGRQDNDLGVL